MSLWHLPLTSLLVLAVARPPGNPAGVTFEDVTRALVRLDAAIAGRPWSEPDRVELNRAHDRAMVALHGGDSTGALRRLQALRCTALGLEGDDLLAALLLGGTRVDLGGRFGGESPSVRFVSLYQVPELGGRSIEFRLRVVTRGGRTVWQDEALRSVEVTSDGCLSAGPPPRIPALPLEGTYRVEVLDPAGEVHADAPWTATMRSPSRRAQWIEMNLGSLQYDLPVDDPLFEAGRVLDWRQLLLRDKPSPERPREFLVDPVLFSGELTKELQDLQAWGEDPYRFRPGRIWRPVFHRGASLSMTVHAPERLASGSALAPLVVAFHDDGAHEGSFTDPAGLASLVELAERRGFLLAAAHTPDYEDEPSAFASLVETLARSYRVDRDRVFVVGHGRGATCVARILAARSCPIAKAVCIAGGGEFAGETPVFVIAGELDLLTPATTLEAFAARARAIGVPVTYEVLEGRGHVLLLPEALTRAVLWLEPS